MSQTAPIQHDQENQQFTVKTGTDEAELAYAIPEKGIVDFQHTYVPISERNSGIGTKLIEHALNWAKSEEMKVIASCKAVSGFISRNSEYQKLLK
jgi:predicted GNAT family acetyltransferase